MMLAMRTKSCRAVVAVAVLQLVMMVVVVMVAVAAAGIAATARDTMSNVVTAVAGSTNVSCAAGTLVVVVVPVLAMGCGSYRG